MPHKPKFRLYVDEVGNADLNASLNPNHRYLSLTGVIFSLSDVSESVAREVESLKYDFFGSDPDEPVILHRRELSRQKYPFSKLREPAVRRSFDARLLGLLEAWDYRVITVVIDKLAHLKKYKTWQAEPYHYCMQVMLERYVKFLRKCGELGDVLAEARGGKEDRQLRQSFERLHRHGTWYVKRSAFQEHLTSGKLKLKPKKANIAGLQIADLIAHPSYRAMKMTAGGESVPKDFGGKIYNILSRTKYHRSQTGEIEGYGRKWLP